MSATQKIWAIATLIEWLNVNLSRQASPEMRDAAHLLIERAIKEPPE